MKYYISVAEHTFSICCGDKELSTRFLHNYLPFFADAVHHPLFELELVHEDESADRHAPSFTRLNDDAPYIWLGRVGGKEAYGFSEDENMPQSFLCIAEEEDKAWLYFAREVSDQEWSLGLNNAVMLLYALFSSLHKTLLLHSSVVMNGGSAYAFLGESGTGKSTHSDLWVKHIPCSEILNDDNPVMRIVDDEVMVYGSPWSGKRNYYINHGCPLKGFVMLEQAPANRVDPLRGMEAFVSLLVSCSCIRWNREMADNVEKTLVMAINLSGVYRLQCRPDREAAVLCHSALKV